ncbi:MAG: enoyl-CoA hydratase-related protein [Longimicrobiales bacterium]
MNEPILLASTSEGVANLTLNRPDKRNALNGALVHALKEALDRTAADDTVRVVTLSGAGKDFCAGADLDELEQSATQGYEESLRDARSLGALFAKMRSHPRPLVALVTGRALAGGCGLATACDLVLASEDAEFGYPEVHLGFVPALVMTLLRRKVGEGRAFELAVRGARHGAAEARDLGLVNRVFAAATFETEAARYVADLAARPPGAVALTKRLLHDLDGMSFERGLEHAAEVNAHARTSAECRQGVRRFLDKSTRVERA